MKILSITDFGLAGKINGVSEAVLSLAKAQIEVGVEVVVGHTRPNNLVKENFCYLVDNLKKFITLTTKFSPDIVVFNSFYDIKHPLFAFKLKQLNIPYVITFHGGASSNNYKKHHLQKFVANTLIFKSYIRRAKAVCYLNENERQNSIFQTCNARSIIIPNGITIPNFMPMNHDNTKTVEILFFSRLDYIGKGLDILIQSIENCKDWLREHRVHFSFYGYHYNDGTVEKIQSIGDLCEYKGYVIGDEKETIMRHSDIIILPSRSEGMPMSILEALSYGIPCILTPETNMGDVIENNKCGWVSQLSIDSLSFTIKKSIIDFELNSVELQINARKAAKQFDWHNIALDSIELYNSLLINEV